MWGRVVRVASSALRPAPRSALLQSCPAVQLQPFPSSLYASIRFMSQQRSKKVPLNEEIRAPTVSIVMEDGTVRENVDKRSAVREARSLGFDLVQVSLQPSEKPNGHPRVICKMFDFRKRVHSEPKATADEPERKMKGDKDMIYKVDIEAHDEGVKTRRVVGFLEKGHPVNLVIEWGHRSEKRPKGMALYDRLLETIDTPYSVAKSKTTNNAIRARLNPLFKKKKAANAPAKPE